MTEPNQPFNPNRPGSQNPPHGAPPAHRPGAQQPGQRVPGPQRPSQPPYAQQPGPRVPGPRQPAPHPPAASEKLTPNVWHRVHPMTPVLQMGGFLVAVVVALFAFAGNFLQDAFGALVRGENPFADEAEALQHVPFLWVVLLVLAIIVAIGIGIGILYWQWRMTTYRYDDKVVEFRHGIIAKAHRHAGYQRVQSIDVQQKFIARIFGLASLVFDVAGGSGSNITILYLKRAQAEQLRDIILSNVRRAKAEAEQTSPATAAGSEREPGGASSEEGAPAAVGAGQPGQGTGRDAAGTQHNPEAPGMPAGAKLVAALSDRAGAFGDDISESFQELVAPYSRDSRLKPDGELVRVPLHRTIMSALLTTSTLVFLAVSLLGIAALVVVGGLVAAGTVGIEVLAATAASLGPIVFAFVIGVFQLITRNLKFGNFSSRLTGDGVQISQGVFSTERLLVPLDRLQAIEVRQPLLWRIPGWYRVMFNTAGGADSGKGTEGQILLPVGSLDDVQTLMGLVLPEGLGEVAGRPPIAPGAVVHEAIAGTHSKPAAVPGLFAAQPVRTRWLDPLTRGRSGWVVTRAAMAIRRGRLNRRAVFVPHARVQSLGWNQGPVQRAFKAATVHLHSTRGPVVPFIEHLDSHTARQLLFDYAEHTKRARQAMDAV